MCSGIAGGVWIVLLGRTYCWVVLLAVFRLCGLVFVQTFPTHTWYVYTVHTSEFTVSYDVKYAKLGCVVCLEYILSILDEFQLRAQDDIATYENKFKVVRH